MTPTREETTTAHALAQAIRSRQISAIEALEALLARINCYNPALNAIVTLDADGARQRAQEADAALSRGEVWGPLHGVPITIKDSFETAGMRTVSGYPPFANHVPANDAPPVARLREAGAIILGKTNLPTLANGIQCNNPVFGRTNNPWDQQRTPGGSSGGAAAAVAAGLTYLDLGSDIGGSIRQPAHFCGVYGLKATAGRVIGKGHIASPRPLKLPAGWEPLLQLASFGPLARSVDDLRLGLPLIAAPNTPRLEAVPIPTLSNLRIAWTDDFGGAPLDADSRRIMLGFADSLTRAGCQVKRITRANFDFEDAWNLSGVCLGTINTLFQSPPTQWLRRLTSPVLSVVAGRHPLMRGLTAGMSLNPARVRLALNQREILIDQLEGFLGKWDAWLCPAFPSPAFTHRATTAPVEVDEARLSQILANLLHSIIFNVTGNPVVVIPVGQSSSGLPIGVQVVGRRWQETALLNVAEQIAALTPGYQVPPGYGD